MSHAGAAGLRRAGREEKARKQRPGAARDVVVNVTPDSLRTVKVSA